MHVKNDSIVRKWQTIFRICRMMGLSKSCLMDKRVRCPCAVLPEIHVHVTFVVLSSTSILWRVVRSIPGRKSSGRIAVVRCRYDVFVSNTAQYGGKEQCRPRTASILAALRGPSALIHLALLNTSKKVARPFAWISDLV